MLLFLCKLEISIKRFFCNLFTSKPCTHTSTPLYDSMIKELQNIVEEIKSIKDQLHKDKKLLEEELLKRDVIINSMIENLPDMLWFKDTDGKYLYANKAIRENLLLSANPVGQTDVELAKQAKLIWGDRQHTFGETCGNSDKDVLENNYVGKEYVESGKVKGKILHLAVNKSIVKASDKIIGVVGSGRDITEYREELISSGKEDIFKINEFKNKDEH